MLPELHRHARPVLRDPTLVLAFEGWNDAGGAATGAARFVADALAAAPLAEIDPEPFYDFTVRRPRVRIGPDGVHELTWPRNEFRYTAPPGREALVVGLGIEPHLGWRRYGEVVVGLARELGARRVVLLGGYLADVLYSLPPAVTGFSHPPRLREALEVPGSAYEGPTGIVGVLGAAFAREGLEVLSLWTALPHYISAQPNPRGALALVRCLARALALELDVGGLEREAEAFEQRISALVASDPDLSEYVRELKRREFAS